MTARSAPSPRRLSPATVLFAGVGLVAGCTSPIASTLSPAPITCTLEVDRNDHMTRFQGQVRASEALSGSYSLTLVGGGTNIRQGGPFSARPGETVSLGQANLSGTPERYDANLSVTVNGTTYNCAPET